METKSALAALAALAQENRLAVFRLLVEQGPQGLTAGAIGERLKVPPATLSFHLKELANARLVSARQDGRFIWYRANFNAMSGLIAYLSDKCCQASAVCDPACAPAAPRQLVAAAMSASRRRKSA